MKPEAKDFPLDEARRLVRPLMKPDPRIYWADFLFHVTLGWAAFATALLAPALSALQIAAWMVAGLALYRAVIFIHELAHLKKGTFRVFRVVWNLICGIPLLVPSFMYDGVHNDHHKRDVYGTEEDGEYLPFAVHTPLRMVGYVLLSFILPLLLLARFLVLAPLSWLSPRLSRLVWARASSLTIDFDYERPANAIRNDHNWRLQEALTFLVAAGVVGGTASGALPMGVIALWYAVAVLIFFLNSLRTLAAHAYRNPGDRPMSIAEQFLDSVNVPGHPFLTALWAPVGLRYHATHHLFPNLPYHNLGKAHRLLVRELSDNSLYLAASRRSLWDALRRIWHDAREAAHEGADRGRHPPPSAAGA